MPLSKSSVSTLTSAARPSLPSPSAMFLRKKQMILNSLSLAANPQNSSSYVDNSPKGSVDVQILGLIQEINKIEGLVTTSSCSGRVAVFMEGVRASERGTSEQPENDAWLKDGKRPSGADSTVRSDDRYQSDGFEERRAQRRKDDRVVLVRAGTGGKGCGGRWLFVSHEPIVFPATLDADNDTNGSRWTGKRHDGHFLTFLFGLSLPLRSQHHRPGAMGNDDSVKILPFDPHGDQDQSRGEVQPASYTTTDTGSDELWNKVFPALQPVPPRLVRFAFEPLILHVLCSSLHHARLLLSAAINAGFRESGVQSLRQLDEFDSSGGRGVPGTGTMVAVRSTGLGLESIVGIVSSAEESGSTNENEVLVRDRDGGDQEREAVTEMTAEAIVSEEYLELLVKLANDRFKDNAIRRDRLMAEIRSVFQASEIQTHMNEGRRERMIRNRQKGLIISMSKKAQMEKTETDEAPKAEDESDSESNLQGLLFASQQS